MDQGAFLSLVEEVVGEVLHLLESELGARLENVEIAVEDVPSDEDLEAVGIEPGETLYGLYEGVPRTERSVFQVSAFPDRITIYRVPIESDARDAAELREKIRRTVLHEMAHHFGISDDRLMELDAY